MVGAFFVTYAWARFVFTPVRRRDLLCEGSLIQGAHESRKREPLGRAQAVTY